jgi:hypothetical protein
MRLCPFIVSMLFASALFASVAAAEKPSEVELPGHPYAAEPLERVALEMVVDDAAVAKQLRVYAVDETCFPEAANPVMAGASHTSFGTAGKMQHELTLDTANLSTFPAFRDAVLALVKKKKDRISVFGVSMNWDTVYGVRALCIHKKPLIDAGVIQRVPDAESFVVTFDKKALAALKKAPKGTLRVALTFNSDVIKTFALEELLAAKAGTPFPAVHYALTASMHDGPPAAP